VWKVQGDDWVSFGIDARVTLTAGLLEVRRLVMGLKMEAMELLYMSEVLNECKSDLTSRLKVPGPRHWPHFRDNTTSRAFKLHPTSPSTTSYLMCSTA